MAQRRKGIYKASHSAGKIVIGVCLGAQLIACVLNAKVYPNRYEEIGWFEVKRTLQESDLMNNLNSSFTCFHWHGDTFDLPNDAQHLLQSEACANQAFSYKQNVLGLQFHLEATTETLREMIHHGRAELVRAKYVQSEEEILAQADLIKENNQRLYSILNKLEQST